MDLDDLDKEDFERLVNDLLLAEFAPSGRFVPFATSTGKNDRGYDASYDGPFQGTNGHWTVSAKHVKLLATLRAKVLQDARRHRDRRWLVVTQLSVPPDDALRTELQKEAPGSEVMGREHLEALLGKHAWIARYYRLAAGLGLLAPAGRVRPELPDRRRQDVARLRERLRGGVRVLIVEAPIGSGGTQVAQALAADLYDHPVERVPIWVTASSAEQLAALAEDERGLGAVGPHVVIVPPSTVARRVAELLVSGAPESRSTIAFLSPVQAQGFREQGTLRYPLAPLTPTELQDWVRELEPSSRDDFVAAVVSLCGDRPEAARSLLADGMAGVRDDIAGVLHDADGLVLCGSDVLAWLLLLAPLAAAPELDAVADRTGLGRVAVERVLELALRHGLLVRSGGRIRERSPVLVAAVVQRVVGDDPAGRFAAGVDGLPPALQWRVASRLGRFTPIDGPLRTRLRETGGDVTRDFTEAQRALQRACEVAAYSASLALAAGAVSDAALERLKAGSPFTPLLTRQLAQDLSALLVAVSRWPEHVVRAADELVELCTLVPTLDRRALSAAIADPTSPPTRDLQAVVGALARRAQDSQVGVELLAGAGEILLADGVKVTSLVGRRLAWGTLDWETAVGGAEEVRRAVVDALLAGTDPLGTDPAVGWRALAGLWRPSSALDRRSIPRSVGVLAESVLSRALATLSTAASWATWAACEGVVLRYFERELIAPRRAAEAIRSFPTDPRYQAWRWMVRSDDFLPDPLAAAATVEAGGGWEALVGHLGDIQVPSKGLVERLAERVATLDGVRSLLDEVGKALDSGSNPLHAIDLLAEWIQLEPALFRPLVVGREWTTVPRALRAVVLHAARDVFGSDVRGLVDGAAFGAALDLANLLHRPHRVDGPDVAELLPALLAYVPPENHAATLFRLADHPDDAARTAVAGALSYWILARTPKPDPRDAVAIVDKLARSAAPGMGSADGALGTLATRIHARGDVLTDDVAAAVGWALLDAVVAGAPGAWPDRAAIEVAAARDEARWLRAVTCLVDGGRVFEACEILPASPGLLRSVALAAIGSGDLPRWGPLLERALPKIEDEVPRLAGMSLDAGRPADAALILGSVATVGSEAWLRAVDRLLGAAAPTDVEAFVERCTLVAASGARGAGDVRRSAAWMEAATRHPSSARILRRIADVLGVTDDYLQEALDDHGD